MLTFTASLATWLALGLPPACAVLAFAHAREAHLRPARLRIGFWSCLAVLIMTGAFLGMEAAGQTLAADGCSAGADGPVCATIRSETAQILADIFGRLAAYLPLVALLTAAIGAAALIRALRART
ncbi:hypothetical protein [Pseudaestuariivita sp.]|uniref:hypothetical protein n=1 Tax=Pseudaestuariivita sp. TaxID=2211669 RepID=UPI00405874FF